MFSNALYMATESGHFVNEAHRRIAEIIADYDPNLRLAYIPDADRNPNDLTEKPFAVIDLGDGTRPPTAIMFADECDEKLLARVFNNDLQRVDVFSKLRAEDSAKEAIEMKKRIEREAFAVDIARTFKRRSFS